MRASTLALVFVAAVGCAETSPPRQFVLGESASVCFQSDASRAAALLTAQNIQEVTPLYAMLSSHGSPVARLRGASIQLAAREGLTPEALDTMVECYRETVTARPGEGADALLALPAERLTISTEWNARGPVLKLSCPQIDDARLVLAAASARVGRAAPAGTN